MPKPGDEIREEYIPRVGGLRSCLPRERKPTEERIGAFPFGNLSGSWDPGTVVCVRGDNRGVKAGCIELGSRQPGTHSDSTWMQPPDDLKQSMRIDRQKQFVEDDKQFWDYRLQVANQSIACLLVRTNSDFDPKAVCRRLSLSLLDTAKNVMIIDACMDNEPYCDPG